MLNGEAAFDKPGKHRLTFWTSGCLCESQGASKNLGPFTLLKPRKIGRSGLFEAVQGNILIYVHKEKELDDVEQRYPAAHYVLVDDKVRILASVKKIWGERVTTVFPRQGHYAHDAAEVAKYPKPDITVERIGDLVGLEREAYLSVAKRG